MSDPRDDVLRKVQAIIIEVFTGRMTEHKAIGEICAAIEPVGYGPFDSVAYDEDGTGLPTKGWVDPAMLARLVANDPEAQLAGQPASED